MMIDKQKIGKSLGNDFSIPTVRDRGFTGVDLRYFFLHAHYTNFQDFTWDHLKELATGRKNLIKKLRNILTTHPQSNLTLFHDLVTARYGHNPSLLNQCDGICNNVLQSDRARAFFRERLALVADDVATP